MMMTQRLGPWVVYLMPLVGKPDGLRAVCSQAEWDTMEKDRPGFRTLVQAGIRSEGEAERLARGTSGDPVPRAAQTNARRGEATPGPTGVPDGS
jgi:hypothetical protein